MCRATALEGPSQQEECRRRLEGLSCDGSLYPNADEASRIAFAVLYESMVPDRE